MKKVLIKRAFSLVELLIVITIVGILAVAFLPKITQGPARARDTQRVSDLTKIANALQVHYQDYGMYPSEPSGTPLSPSSSAGTALTDYFNGGVLPTDPITGRSLKPFSGVGDGYYFYASFGSDQGYLLAANVEHFRQGIFEYKYVPDTYVYPSSGEPPNATPSSDPDNVFYIIFSEGETGGPGS